MRRAPEVGERAGRLGEKSDEVVVPGRECREKPR